MVRFDVLCTQTCNFLARAFQAFHTTRMYASGQHLQKWAETFENLHTKPHSNVGLERRTLVVTLLSHYCLASCCQEFKKIFKNDPSVQKLKVIDVWQWTIIVKLHT